MVEEDQIEIVAEAVEADFQYQKRMEVGVVVTKSLKDYSNCFDYFIARSSEGPHLTHRYLQTNLIYFVL